MQHNNERGFLRFKRTLQHQKVSLRRKDFVDSLQIHPYPSPFQPSTLMQIHQNSNHKAHDWNILKIYPAKQYLKLLISEESEYNIAPLIYFFQQRFCDQQNFNKTEKSKEVSEVWVKSYIEYLPHDYGFMPYHYSHLIKNYHLELGNQLQSFGEKLRFNYQFLKSILEGRDLPEQLQFLSYLKRKTEDHQYFYQKYYQNFTFDSFQWAYFTWKTRVFDKGCQRCKSASGLFIPILDLINHDKLRSNADWIFDDGNEVMRLSARKDIQNGQQLLIDYGQRTTQMFFQDYGFIARQQACEVKIKINQGIKYSFFVNSLLISEQTKIGLKQQIRTFMQKCNTISQTVTYHQILEQLKKNSLQKQQNISKICDSRKTKMYSAQQIEELLTIQRNATESIFYFIDKMVKLQY